MRIVGGIHGGRRLQCPSGNSVRPTPDKVREALFSILGKQVEDTTLLDIFSGTGSVGLEAISRGARHVTFIENGRRTLPCLRKNLTIAPPAQVTLMPIPVRHALPQLRGYQFDMVFMDPPYGKGLVPQTLNQLKLNELITKQSLIICEHERRLQEMGWTEPWHIRDQRTWGEVSITMLALRSNA